MKCISTLDVKTDDFLKVKKRTLIITNSEASSNSKGKIKGDGQASSHPVIVWDANDLMDDIESTEVLETSKNVEDFQHRLANG